MDPYTRLTKAWLDTRHRGRFDGEPPIVYFAHEPIYGIGSPHCEPHHARRIVRLFQLLRRVRAAGGRTLLDVGGCEGYFAYLAREVFGMTVFSVDLSEENVRRAAEIFAVPGASVDAAALPFASGSFDVVTCAEVVEHLADPVAAILELQRVARGAVVLATEEWHSDATRRDHDLAERRASHHGERSLFADADLRPLFEPLAITVERQVVPDLREFATDAAVDRGRLRQVLLALVAEDRPAAPGAGIVLTAKKPVHLDPTPRIPGDEEIVARLLGEQRPLHVMGAPTPTIAWGEAIEACCVRCGAVLEKRLDELQCACGYRSRRHNGVFSFVDDHAPFPARVDAMLADRGGVAYPWQREDLLELARKLELPFEVLCEWRFDRPEDAARWSHFASCRFLAPGRYRVDGPDPWLQNDTIACSPAEAQVVTVEMAVHLDQPVEREIAVTRWQVDGQTTISEAAIAGVDVVADGTMRTYRFVAPRIVRGEMLLRLRFDPMRFGRGEVHLRSLRIDAELPPG